MSGKYDQRYEKALTEALEQMSVDERKEWVSELLRRSEEESWHRLLPANPERWLAKAGSPEKLAASVMLWVQGEFPEEFGRMLGQPPEPESELEKDPEFGKPADPSLAWEWLERLTSEELPRKG